MLRTIPRTIRLRTLLQYAQPIAVRRPVLATRRLYADKKSPPDNDTPPPVSEYIASQPPPSNPETPADRMPHQTEEDIATEKILSDTPRTGNEDGLPPEAVPVEEVFKGDPEAMEKAPEVIKDDISFEVVEEQGGSTSTDDAKMLHVTEESIATERIISGSDNVPGAVDSTPGKETPAAGVPIEDVIGDGEKPAVMEESSKNDDEPPPNGQILRTDDQSSSSTTTETTTSTDTTMSDDSVSTTRKSILDLFGPASGNKRKSVEPETAEPRFNPLKSHQLEPMEDELTPPEDPLPAIPPDVNLAAWEENIRQEHEKSIKDIDPEEWATSQRGSWDEPIPLDDAPSPPSRPPLTRPVRPRGTKIRTVEPKIFEAKAVTPWDYFYPAPKTPKTIDWAKQTARERENPHLRQPTDPVYDPFAEVVKPQRWPFIYNRDQLLHKCVNHLMTHGKKARAEKVMQQTLLKILEHNPRVHPVTYLAEALDRNSPLVKNSNNRQGSKIVIQPFALFETQRIRIGWKALIDAAGGKMGRERTRERIPFAERLAREVIKVMEGRGPGLANRLAQHKTAMINKLSVKPRGSR